jgi:hypothetical protein
MGRSDLYIAVIGDLVESRAIKDRNAVQKKLEKTLNRINTGKTKDAIISRFRITLGDEFQGLVSRHFSFQAFMDQYQRDTGEELNTRFGIGLGGLATDLKEEAVGMDGPCFHHARSALESARKMKTAVFFSGFEADIALNALFQSCDDIRRKWKKRQSEVIHVHEKYGDQITAAKKLDISRQAVHLVLKAARYELYKSGMEGVQQLISFSVSNPAVSIKND